MRCVVSMFLLASSTTQRKKSRTSIQRQIYAITFSQMFILILPKVISLIKQTYRVLIQMQCHNQESLPIITCETKDNLLTLQSILALKRQSKAEKPRFVAKPLLNYRLIAKANRHLHNEYIHHIPLRHHNCRSPFQRRRKYSRTLRMD